MSARRPIVDARPPTFVSRETGAAELDFSVDTWDAMVAAGKLPPPIRDGLWWWPDIDRAIDPDRPHDLQVGYVYFIGFRDYVKIGFTSRPLNERMERLQTGAPEKLEVFATLLADRRTERELHGTFAAYRTHGEWFRCEGRLAVYIQSLQAVDSGHG